MTQAIDWDLAARRAGRLVKAGPAIDHEGALELVSSLRSAAADAPSFVADVTGLGEAAAAAADGPVYVVDRPGWASTAVETFRVMSEDLLPPTRVPGASRLAAQQLAWAVSMLSSRILGQFDPYTATVPGEGRLLLVAPTVLAVQRQIDADPIDFHLWVCLHEQTHAVQFAAAPWLAGRLRESLRSVLASQLDDDADTTTADATTAGDTAPGWDGSRDEAGDLAPGEPEEAGEAEVPRAGAFDPSRFLQRIVGPRRETPNQLPGLLEVVLGEDQREVLLGAVAIMSLLEGHADVVMDEVGPRAIPTVRAIRKAFDARREERTVLTVLLRRLLGMDAKLAQYRDGAAFVRAVTERVGHEGLNAVWSGPEALPSPEEITDPASWIARVHG